MVVIKKETKVQESNGTLYNYYPQVFRDAGMCWSPGEVLDLKFDTDNPEEVIVRRRRLS